MKIKYTLLTHPLVVIFSISLLTGCKEGCEFSSKKSSEQGVTLKEKLALKDVESKTGITFPKDTVLINVTDGGERDQSYGFYVWRLFSPDKIKMPIMKATGVGDYLNVPIESALRRAQENMGSRKILQPKSAFYSEWKKNGFSFQGTIVRTDLGDYLVLEQFHMP